jgi:hypothetical protein
VTLSTGQRSSRLGAHYDLDLLAGIRPTRPRPKKAVNIATADFAVLINVNEQCAALRALEKHVVRLLVAIAVPTDGYGEAPYREDRLQFRKKLPLQIHRL